MVDKRAQWIAALNECINTPERLYQLLPHLTGIRDYLVNQHETQPPALSQRLAGREDENGFRYLAPKQLLDREIVTIGEFIPGNDSHYASAYVVTRKKKKYEHRRLICQDDNRSGQLTWYLINQI